MKSFNLCCLNKFIMKQLDGGEVAFIWMPSYKQNVICIVLTVLIEYCAMKEK